MSAMVVMGSWERVLIFRLARVLIVASRDGTFDTSGLALFMKLLMTRLEETGDDATSEANRKLIDHRWP
jgi:hypothetical protein